uniref:Uncharacterized protein n=1 Tax=Echeneis naucrates TaxID=173247 RepID=A0A665X1V7_ECHNA
MVTDRAIYLGNEFTFNAGAGLVISQPEGVEERNATVVDQLRASFERDWFSRYTRSLQANKIPMWQINPTAHTLCGVCVNCFTYSE